MLSRTALASLPAAALAALLLASAPALAAPTAPAGRCPEEALPPAHQAAVVKGIQTELAIAGFDAGALDGVLGRRTREAIREYQAAAGIRVDGCPSHDLLQRLSFGLPKVFAPGRPPAEDTVARIQEELTRRGFYVGAVDGRAGPRTREGIRQLELEADRPLTGEPDPTLLAELRTGMGEVRR